MWKWDRTAICSDWTATCIMVQTPRFEPTPLGSPFAVRAHPLLPTSVRSSSHSQLIPPFNHQDGFDAFDSAHCYTHQFDRYQTRTCISQSTTSSCSHHGRRYSPPCRCHGARRGPVIERRFQRHFRLCHGTSLRHRPAALMPDSQSHRSNVIYRTRAHRVATTDGNRYLHLLRRPARREQSLGDTLQALVLFPLPRNADPGLHGRQDAIPSSVLRDPALAGNKTVASKRAGNQLRAEKERTRHSSERALVLRSASMLAFPRQHSDPRQIRPMPTLPFQHLCHVQSRVPRRALPLSTKRGRTANPPTSQRARLAKLSTVQVNRRPDPWRMQPHDLPMRVPVLLRLRPALEDVPLSCSGHCKCRQRHTSRRHRCTGEVLGGSPCDRRTLEIAS
jgi:hypothetical protein